ncbi:hypothetical protein BJ508DRAFT_363365 [Ascobolus immersus RN42]|uniref:Uncharacterized protein n=1 Tax=Ascobolus immersus RN42 TaxID=1160509 RepID=A0A3N4HZ98_ASCIM|nr:hypothetical protein BJ508DRAFT_363365 [Ascobolus immersus RN42]
MALSEIEKVVVTALLLTTIPFIIIITLLSYCLFRSRRRVRQLRTRLDNLEKDRRANPLPPYRRPHSSTFERAITRESILSSPTSTMHSKLRSAASSPSLPTHQVGTSRRQSTASPITARDEFSPDKIFVTIHPSTPDASGRAVSPTMTNGSATLASSPTTFSQSSTLRASMVLDTALNAIDRIETDEFNEDDGLPSRLYSKRKPTYSETSSLITDAPSKSRADSYVSDEHRREFEKLKYVRFSELDRLVKAKGLGAGSRDTMNEKHIVTGESEEDMSKGKEVRIKIQRNRESRPVELGDEGEVRISSQASWYYDDGV